MSQFEILPNQRPERPLFSESCLLYAQRQTLAQGHRYFCSYPGADIHWIGYLIPNHLDETRKPASPAAASVGIWFGLWIQRRVPDRAFYASPWTGTRPAIRGNVGGKDFQLAENLFEVAL
jgi:hypothetical protein